MTNGRAAEVDAEMDCSRVREALELYVLDGLEAERREAVERHLGSCWECREAEAELRAIVEGIREGARRADAAFHERLRSAVACEMRYQRRRLRLRRAALGAAAAAAAAALVVSALLGARGASEPWGALGERWRVERVRATPASAADRVVVREGVMFCLKGQRPVEVVAVATASGRVLWRSAVGAVGYLAADASRVYCVSRAEGGGLGMVALDARSGRVLWRHGGAWREAPTRPVPLGGERLCWSVGREVRVLKARSGKLAWRFQAEGGLVSAALPLGDALFVASASRLYCLGSQDGSVRWTLGLGEGSRLSRPVLASDGRVVFLARRASSGVGEALAVEPGARRALWRRQGLGASDLLVHGGRLFVRGPREVAALEAGSGALLWRLEVSGCGPLSVVGGALCFVDSSGSGRLVAVDVERGSPVRSVAGIRSCDAVRSGGRVAYLKTNDGVVHAIASSALIRS